MGQKTLRQPGPLGTRFNNDMMSPDGHRDDILYVGHSQGSPFAMVPLCSESKIELRSRWMGSVKFGHKY